MAEKIESKFVRIKCAKCKSSQVIFGKASTKIKCTECDTVLALPSGGKAKIRARVEEVL
jgi:small subunit ribosomal protein S27e